jgi:signal transduction histidine kinase
MSHTSIEGVGTKPHSPVELLPKERRILERPLMVFRPFGLDEEGQTIRDLSGMSVRAIVLYLERTIGEERGAAAGGDPVRGLCRLLNQRIKDPIYHVTPEFLKNPWNSYSYEFAAFLYEFCEELAGDPQFVFRAGMEKASPIMQVLARPFSIQQIYEMFPYFANKFASGSIECRVVEIGPASAMLAMRFSQRTLSQFGPFRRRCAHVVCQSAQGILAAVPARVHGLSPASVTSISCIADDDDWCRWTIRWKDGAGARWGRRRVVVQHATPHADVAGSPPESRADRDIRWPSKPQRHAAWFVWSCAGGVMVAAALWSLFPMVHLRDLVLTGLLPILVAGLLINRHLRKESTRRERLIQEQISFVESRHEELREAYLEQEQTRVELRRKVTQLTALHRAGLLFSSTLDRSTLLQQVLETLTQDLHYDRAMISFCDPVGQVIEHARVMGVSEDVRAFAESCRIPVSDPLSPEGTVVLQGRPLLIEDIRTVWPHLHPLNQTLVELSKTQALIVVPLKTKERIIGTLTVDRTEEHSLTQDDLDLMITVANQVAISLDNASAYQQIEEWNAGLELKVRERTAALEQADRLRSQFLSHVSHELKTPLTSIKGFLQNLLDGLTGPLNEKQQRYLSRMLDNSDRLIRMIEDLLDRTSIEAGRVEMVPSEVDVATCFLDVIEQLRPLASAKGQRLDIPPATHLTVWADRDRLIQVIVNLVHNAIKYTPNGGAITVSAQAYLRTVRIAVRDTGPGLPPDCLERVFDPFFRVQQGHRSGPKGLGLGLSIVRNLVELQGGQVTASNDPEGGAEFAFTIPVPARAASTTATMHLRSGKILVADDDADIRQLLLDRLYAQGYQPHAVVDRREALEAMGREQFGGVILDVGLTPINGLDLLQHIRKEHPQVPIIMITASGSQELGVRALSGGAQAYLLKPFESGELQHAIQTWFPLG